MQTKTHEYLHESDLPALAREYRDLWLKPGTVVALHGDLGAGKTAFVRAFVREVMGAETPVPSPTFTLVQPYETGDVTIHHYDLYRLADISELTELNWQAACGEGLVFVEWPERAGNLLPPHWRVEISDGDAADTRMVKITPPGISVAMVLAAGMGTRLRPLTNNTPKPLLKLGDKTMLDHALDAAADAGITRAVVNTHYLGEQIAAHVKARTRPQIVISPEENILETGGGIKNALSLLGTEVFFTLNADVMWRDLPGDVPALRRMMDFWNPDVMDTLLLLAPRERAVGFDGPGDYFMAADSALTFRGAQSSAPYLFAGAAIVKAAQFENYPDKNFSQKKLWDIQEKSGRLFGIAHSGDWYHCSTPADFAAVNAALS